MVLWLRTVSGSKETRKGHVSRSHGGSTVPQYTTYVFPKDPNDEHQVECFLSIRSSVILYGWLDAEVSLLPPFQAKYGAFVAQSHEPALVGRLA